MEKGTSRAEDTTRTTDAISGFFSGLFSSAVDCLSTVV